MVPNGSANVEKQCPSYFLLSHASYLRCDRGSGLGPKGIRWHFKVLADSWQSCSYYRSAQQQQQEQQQERPYDNAIYV